MALNSAQTSVRLLPFEAGVCACLSTALCGCLWVCPAQTLLHSAVLTLPTASAPAGPQHKAVLNDRTQHSWEKFGNLLLNKICNPSGHGRRTWGREFRELRGRGTNATWEAGGSEAPSGGGLGPWRAFRRRWALRSWLKRRWSGVWNMHMNSEWLQWPGSVFLTDCKFWGAG